MFALPPDLPKLPETGTQLHLKSGWFIAFLCKCIFAKRPYLNQKRCHETVKKRIENQNRQSWHTQIFETDLLVASKKSSEACSGETQLAKNKKAADRPTENKTKNGYENGTKTHRDHDSSKPVRLLRPG